MVSALVCMKRSTSLAHSSVRWWSPSYCRRNYRTAFAVLLVPAIVTLCLLLLARFLYPKPEDLEISVPNVQPARLPRVFRVYLTGAAPVGAGFADFSLMAFHFEKAAVISKVPIFYSVALAVSGLGALLFGRFFDRVGLWMLIPLTLIAAVATSMIPAAVATMVLQRRRPSAYGILTVGYGVSWFIGSVIIGKTDRLLSSSAATN
jgi:hypothetical protein